MEDREAAIRLVLKIDARLRGRRAIPLGMAGLII